MFHSISINFMKHPALALPQFTVTILFLRPDNFDVLTSSLNTKPIILDLLGPVEGTFHDSHVGGFSGQSMLTFVHIESER